MTGFLVLIGAILGLIGLILLQLNVLRKCHPNAEMLIEQFRTLITDDYKSGDQLDG